MKDNGIDPGKIRGPGKTELRRFLEQGLTQREIVEAWEEKSGIRVSRSAIGMAIARYGLQSAHPRPRYEETIPWIVREEHRMNNNARMLRLEGKRRLGQTLTDREKHLLTQWRKALQDAGAVVTYSQYTAEGFHWIVREEKDDDIIRRPARL